MICNISVENIKRLIGFEFDEEYYIYNNDICNGIIYKFDNEGTLLCNLAGKWYPSEISSLNPFLSGKYRLVKVSESTESENKEKNMERIDKIEELLGVKMGEKFKIYYADNNTEYNAEYNGNEYMLTEEGLEYYNFAEGEWMISVSTALYQLMVGEIYAKKIPSFPENGTEYYRVSIIGDVYRDYFNKGVGLDVLYYKIGNFYNTHDEAEKNREKWIEFFNSPNE